MVDEWYFALNKPELTPPNWVFAPVWITLYCLMAIAFFLVVKDGNVGQKVLPITFFLIQFMLNLSWSPVFFGKHNIFLAFIIIILMYIFLILTIISFYKVSKVATLLLVPYFLWLNVALYLNYQILMLNQVNV